MSDELPEPGSARRWFHPALAVAALLWVGPLAIPAAAQPAAPYLSQEAVEGSFPLVGPAVPLVVSVSGDAYAGVIRVAEWFRDDLATLQGVGVSLETDGVPSSGRVILVGTVGTGGPVDQLAAAGHLPAHDLVGRDEAYVIQVVESPMPGVDRALVIAGSDKRGTIYGMLDLVRAAGVSPWRWWADAPVTRPASLHVLPGSFASREPAVRYRGFFINDENPALLGWAGETFGGFNAAFYERVFELLLRLRGNYLWPAMWGKAIADDDPRSADLASELGVVLGTSHHEPLTRAHTEWERYGSGPWNFATNEEALSQFWRDGIRRMGSRESLVTVGMRGDGDEPMTQGTAIDLLERIVATQRTIITEETGRPAHETPQVWALYKEVQEYYDQGMRVPDDVTLLFSDDNWGNIRRLPDPAAPPREGGYGVYYHYDYVGGPRNYKWLNTVQLGRVSEQMGRAWQHGADRVWIVNVGDLKPGELPLEFFLDMAWEPARFGTGTEPIEDWMIHWAEAHFGDAPAPAIARVVLDYQDLASLRTPEMLSPETYSLEHFDEARTMLDAWNTLAARASDLAHSLPATSQDAFFHLVQHPILAYGNLLELYVTVARNRQAAARKLATTDSLADRAVALFERDKALADRYESAGGGKWPHLMSQTHIGYTYWQEPPEDVMPDVERLTEPPHRPSLLVSAQGGLTAGPGETVNLSVLDRYVHTEDTITLSAQLGANSWFRIESDAAWLTAQPSTGRASPDQMVSLAVDWTALGPEEGLATLTVTQSQGAPIRVRVRADGRVVADGPGYMEARGRVVLEAGGFIDHRDVQSSRWATLSRLGRHRTAVTATGTSAVLPGGTSPYLAYPIIVRAGGTYRVEVETAPTLDYPGQGGLRYGLSVDDGPIQVVNLHAGASERDWERWVGDRVIRSGVDMSLTPGKHMLRYWLVDPGVVLERIVLDSGDGVPSYLGPPASPYIIN